MTIEAMKQALKALEICAVRQDHQWHGLQQVSIAKAALRQAIEQAEKQEPVGWYVFNKHGRIYFAIGNQSFPVEYTPEDEPDCSAGQAAEWYMDQLRHALTRLATPQPQREWVGLTDEEIRQVFVANSVMVDNGNAYMVAGLRAVNIGAAIEAKLKEKNT